MSASTFSRLLSAAILILAGLTAGADAAGENVAGKWAARVSLPLVPSSGAILPNGKVLLWSADGEFSFSTGSQSQTVLFDPATGSVAKKTVSAGHNLFCTGTTNLADGRILANGGQQTRATTIYDAVTNGATPVQSMNIARGYNSNTILPDGSVLTVGGSWSGGVGEKKAEVWTPTGGWRTLTNVLTDTIAGPTENVGWGRDAHMWLKPAGNGRVFYPGPHPAMQWIDTEGNGAITPAGLRGDDVYAIAGLAVMYDKGRILKMGGNAMGDDAPASASAYKIDITNGVSVSKISPMAYPRAYANAVVLPDGKVMVVGGMTYADNFSDSNTVLPTEIWNPTTGNFTTTASIAVPRNYHSIALLLPDGRVLSAGGGLCGAGCSANHPDLQIYSPGYLFDAAGNLKPRPSIVSAPAELPYGRKIAVTTDRDVTAFSIVRVASTTHTINNDQRRLALTFVKTGANAYELDIPSNPGWMLPGHWMLFAIDADGAPSVSKLVHVTPNAIANMSADAAYSITAGAATTIQPRIARLNAGAVLSVSGLPAGLSFDAASGAITGAASSAGSFPITLTATDGAQIVSIDFRIDVDPAPGAGAGLLADYFNGSNLSGAIVASRVEQPYFADNTVGSGAVASTTAPFSARWSGSVLAQRSGVTAFQTRSDDGVRLWVGGKLLVDNWTPHGATDNQGEIDLVAGVQYPVYIEYQNTGGDNAMQLSWRRPGDSAFAATPTSQLFPSAALLTDNLAQGKAASQSSNYSTTAGLAPASVDGNTNGAWSSGSVSITGNGANEWWQVDLGSVVDIDRVRLWSRTDCCGYLLQNFSLFISDSDMTGRTYAQIMADLAIDKRTVLASNIPAAITIPAGVTGRYVRVQRNDANSLQLAEVEVFGAPINQPPAISGLPARMDMQLGVAVTQQAVATDPEGQSVTFSAVGAPAGVAISPSGAIGGAPTSLGGGVMTVTATDAAGLSSSVDVAWTVASGLPAVTRLRVSPRRAGATIAYDPEVANGFGVLYRWSFGDGSPATSYASVAATTHVYMKPGIYGVTLTMRAADGRETTYSFNQAIYPQGAGAPPPASAGAAYDSPISGAPRLWVANPDNDSVGVIDLSTNRLTVEVPVGKRPVSVAIHPNGDAWVVNRDSATISIVDPTALSVKQTVALPRASRPYGLVFFGRSGVVTLEAAESAALISEAGEVTGTAYVGVSPRHIALAPSGDSVLISRFITPPLPGESTATVRTVDATGKPVGGEVIQLDATGAITRTIVLKHSEKPDTEVSARGIPNYLGAPAIAPNGLTAWVPSKQDNVKRGMLRDGQELDFQTSVRAILSKINLRTGQEDFASRVDLDNAGVASAALYHPSGAYVFVALQTSRQVAVVDPAGARELFRFNVGRAPSGLTLSPDGNTLFVTNFMDRTVSRVNLASLLTRGLNDVSITATIRSIGAEKLGANVLRGKRLFYDAADPRISRDAYLSCAACHDNGEQDGRVWDFTGFGEGLRNTISLEGRGGLVHGFLHRTANFDEIQDFEGQIRAFAQGSGLMSDADFNAGTRAQTLGDRKTGLSADLDALAAYAASLRTFPESPWRNVDGSLTAQAQAGKDAFASKGCAKCHAGARMTISTDATRLKDVGTIKPSSGTRLGGLLTGLDVQTLLGVFSTAPYLHDGSAPTIDDAIRAHTNVSLTASEVANISAYVKQIGGAP